MLAEKDTTIEENNGKAPALWGWHTYVSLGITAAILLILALWVDLEEVWIHFANSNKAVLILGALAHYVTYPVRGLRWRRCLIHLPLKGGKGKFGLLVFFYNFVDNLVPAKLGDVYGARPLQHRHEGLRHRNIYSCTTRNFATMPLGPGNSESVLWGEDQNGR